MSELNITPRTPIEQAAVDNLHDITRSIAPKAKPTQITSGGVDALIAHNQAKREAALESAVKLAIGRLQDIQIDDSIPSPATIAALTLALQDGK